ncbi:Uncharacterized protein BM_BM8956 [Brugia malayi]|uniref:Uncharacterized protein n=1 Tax=Brugia malayi TaxID=6279 RepID=A0A4E9FC61_BRUMA|nr:Uncharacterized protein BM_BM8956 [Brugia malayi]VIO94367.1 Uncharacterized protein BM_BM8956 [Brugia malayi]
MLPLILTIIFFAFKQCSGQLGYGGNGYCSTCALTNSGSISRGFGFGGGNYDLTGKSLYSLPTSNSLIIPSSYGYSSSSYGSGTGYGSTQTNNNLNYGSSSATGILSNSAYSSAGNGYVNCYNNNCLPSSSLNTVPTASSGIGYGISGSNAIYNPYSSLPDASYKTYSLPSFYSVPPNIYTSNSHSGLETSYSLPTAYSSYPAIYSTYGSQGSTSSLNNLLSLNNYQRSRKAAAADDASEVRKSLLASTSTFS